jgi:hypothetical protein
MTPQERDLITQLLGRLKQTAGQAKDPEAEQLIRQAIAEQPDAPYFLVQTVLIQDMALSQAQQRIAELERQLAAAKPAQPTSFLGGLFGRSSAPGSPPASQPSSGPWGRPALQPQYQPPQYQPQPQYQPPPASAAAQPWGNPMSQFASGGSGFLRQAAATAAGVAGGALLFDGIQSMFGHHAGGILEGTAMQPGLSETVINNYYGSDTPGQGGSDRQAWDQTSDPSQSDPNVVPADYAGDAPPDDPQDFASDDDFSSQDDSDYT